MTNHPNATASFVTTGLAAILLHFTHQYHWVNLSAEDALITAGSLITAVLFIGKRGIRPTLSGIWNGAAKTLTGPDAPKT